MTHTTTDAAEARERIARALYFRRNPARYECNEDFNWLCAKRRPASYLADYYADADAILATAEAASGAGERGTGWVFWNPDSGEEYASSHPIESGECCEAERIRPSTPQEDTLWQAFQDQFVRAEAATAALASLPPATDPAMGLDPVTIERCAKVADRMATSTTVPEEANNAAWNLAIAIRALAAAPTIPATGEAEPGSLIEECIKIASIEAADAVESIELGYRPAHNEGARESAERIERRIRALAATIPATGHAATEGEGA